MANEKRLIDANEFWNRLNHVVYDVLIDPEQAGDYAMEGYFKNTIAIVLNQTKTVDAVEVVRCEECKHYRTSGCAMDTYAFDVVEEGFCSYGERRS